MGAAGGSAGARRVGGDRNWRVRRRSGLRRVRRGGQGSGRSAAGSAAAVTVTVWLRSVAVAAARAEHGERHGQQPDVGAGEAEYRHRTRGDAAYQYPPVTGEAVHRTHPLRIGALGRSPRGVSHTVGLIGPTAQLDSMHRRKLKDRSGIDLEPTSDRHETQPIPRRCLAG